MYIIDNADWFSLKLDRKFDLILVDPPTQIEWGLDFDYANFLSSLEQVIHPKGHIIVTSGFEQYSPIIQQASKNYRYSWVWINDKFKYRHYSKRRPLLNFTLFCVYSLNNPFSKNSDISFYPNGKFPRLTIYCPVSKNRSHPGEKPVNLLKYLISLYTKKDDWVLDCMMGSGASGKAALSLDRNFYGIDIDKNYCNQADKSLARVKVDLDIDFYTENNIVFIGNKESLLF